MRFSHVVKTPASVSIYHASCCMMDRQTCVGPPQLSIVCPLGRGWEGMWTTSFLALHTTPFPAVPKVKHSSAPVVCGNVAVHISACLCTSCCSVVRSYVYCNTHTYWECCQWQSLMYYGDPLSPFSECTIIQHWVAVCIHCVVCCLRLWLQAHYIDCE